MKKITSLSLMLLFNLVIFGQCPTTNITLSSQEEINNFSINYPNCTTLTHELKINGETNSITNLDGLSLITTAQDIFIIQTDLTSFTGLDNITTIFNMTLLGNNNIQNLYGLSSVTEIESLVIWVNSGITNLSGLNSIQTINNINLFTNSSLVDISHLSFLSSIESLTIGGNALQDLDGLQNLQTITSILNISNEQIQNFDELSNLESIEGSLILKDNLLIENINAFNNIITLIDLYIINCPNLDNLSGLNNITEVSGTLRIGFNLQLTNLLFLNNITSAGYIDIYENENLLSLSGLDKLEEISHRLFIDSNPSLTSIESISFMSIPSAIEEVVIINNESLEICNNNFICSIIDDEDVEKYIANNATGCNSIEEVEESCLLGFNENNIANQIIVYPNPFSNYFSIYVSDVIRLNSVLIYSVLGEKLLETSLNHISLENFSTGVYFAEINTDQGSIVKKIVKE